MMKKIVTGTLDFDADGHPVCVRHGDIYKNRHGARAEAQQVFVAGCNLPERWTPAKRHTVLEVGFGLGINFLATVDAWRSHHRSRDNARTLLTYIGVEAHPLHREDLRRGLRSTAHSEVQMRALCEVWPEPVAGLHLRQIAPDIRLILAIGCASEMLPELVCRADSIYLDAFTPSRNPVPWSATVMRTLARLAAPGCRLATFTAAHAVQRALRGNGFHVDLRSGSGGKQQVIAGVFEGLPRADARHRSATSLHGQDDSEADTSRRACVVGMGLAGRAVTAELLRRGWRVECIDAGPDKLTGTAAQPALAAHLHVSVDDNPLARLSRAASGLLPTTAPLYSQLSARGRLQLADDASDADRLQHMVATLQLPASTLSYVSADEASERAGLRLTKGGLWMPRALLATGFATLPDFSAVRAATRVSRIEQQEGQWQLHDQHGTAVTSADVVVFCTARPPAGILSCESLETTAFRGQSTRFSSELGAALRCVVSDGAYACPLPDGQVLAGASYAEDHCAQIDARDTRANLARWHRMTGEHHQHVQVVSDHVGVRHATRDHLPCIGPLANESIVMQNPTPWARNDRLALPLLPGLYFAGGFGSRGLLWAALAGAMIADMLDGNCLPVERQLARAVAPARMLQRRLRQHAR